MKKVINNKGITLIALVITIVILLILAGITINQLAGDNGLFKRAKEASEKTQETQLKEEITLAVQSAITEGIGDITQENLAKELENIDDANVSYNDETKKFTVSRGKYGYTVDLNGNIVSTNGIALNKSTLNLFVGSEETLTASYLGSVSGEITWTSSDPTVVTVANGKVTVVGSTGSATITAKCGNYTATCKVTIIQKITGITAEAIKVGKGKTKQIVVKTIPESNVEGITYSYQVTSGGTYATVDASTGVVSGTAIGSATVTITGTKESGGTVSTTCAVTVIEVVEGTLDVKGLTWTSLSNMSREIENKSEVGTSVTVGTNTVSIGDTKSITIKDTSGTEKTYLAEIIGFNHDVRANGTKIGISFQLKDCMKNIKYMKKSDTNAGGWANCAIRSYLNTDASYNVYNNIEQELKEKIVAVKKQTGLYENQSTLSETTDKLWLLSEKEVFGSKQWAIDAEANAGKQYAYYADTNNSKVKKVNGSASNWWLRSPYCTNSKGFCYVNTRGSVQNSNFGYTSTENGVMPGFAI